MAIKRTILVTGATGKQGGAVARHLLQKGFSVKALTRNPSSANAEKLKSLGAEIMKGDMEDKESLVKALQGCTGVFSVQNYWEKGIGYEGEIRQGKNVVDAARQANIQHFVQASIAGCDRAPGVKHIECKWEVEKYIQNSGLSYTFLRTVFFMNNFFDPKGKGVLMPLLRGNLPPTLKFHMVAVEDVGAIAAIVFAHPEQYKNKAIQIASDLLTTSEMEQILQEVTGKKSPSFKIPKWLTVLMNAEMARQFKWNSGEKNNEGWKFSLEETKSVLPELTSFKTFLEKHIRQS